MVDSTGFVVHHTGGVQLGVSGGTEALGIPADSTQLPDLAYIEYSGDPNWTYVYLVTSQTVSSARRHSSIDPRGFVRVPAVSDSSAPGQAVAADGDLWMLSGAGSGPGTTHTVHQLSLPQHSDQTGATLRDRGLSTVTGPAALSTATVASEGTGPSVVGLASAGRIQIFGSGESGQAESQTVTYRSPAGLDQILPVSDSQGRLVYLLHGDAGWYVLSVATDGSDLRVPLRVTGVDPSSDLATPAESDGSVYTMGTGANGRLYRIGLDGTAEAPDGIATYPLMPEHTGKAVDTENGFADGYVIARGSRVIYDSAGHRRAVAIFTDGSHAPVVLTKSDAVNLNASGDALALSQNRIRHIVQGRNNPSGPTVNPGNPGHHQNPPGDGSGPKGNGGNPNPPDNPGKGPGDKNKNPTNNNHDCTNTDQTPYAPIISSAVPAARSVLLKWYYPRVNNTDCVPQTYVVTAQLISNGAPAAPGSVTVQNQEFVNLGGLYPSSQYSITVTAYLGDKSTDSAARSITTTAEGPPAPTGLSVTSDANGNWKLTWDSCGTIGDDCITASSWQITPTVCDGRGLTSDLATVEADADPSTKQQPTATYPGSAALLGRGLSFQVLGQSSDGTPGVLSAPSPCVYSWSTPQTKNMTITASTDQEVTLGSTATAKVALNLGDDPATDVGGLGAQITFTLTGGGTTATSDPVTYDGTQSTVSASFDVVKPGAQYTATATITPGHGNGGPAT
ncbi:MAG: hypothetical protein INR72_17615, partial [Williamsia herbipolensis]|nr:hypothetical protein [Williamsia herbipolensis]